MNDVDRQTEKLIDIRLDEKTFVRRKPEVEREREIAIRDLLEENAFRPVGSWVGPYALIIRLSHGWLTLDIRDQEHRPLTEVTLSQSTFRSLIRDYFQLCESYYNSASGMTTAHLEALDFGRRGIHDEGAHLLRDCLEGKVELDFDTARRLFTLICVLHIQG